MLFVQLVAADQAVGGAIPGITVVIVAEQAVDEPFTQGTHPPGSALDVEGLEMAIRMARPEGEHGQPFGRQPFSCNFIESAAGDGLTHQLLQLGQGDPLALALGQHDLLQRLDGAGGADAGAPAEDTVVRSHFLQYRLGGGNGLVARASELAITRSGC